MLDDKIQNPFLTLLMIKWKIRTKGEQQYNSFSR